MSLLATALAALLATALAPDVCEALNVTVSPGPTVRYSEGDNATLYCHISQKRKTDNLLAVRWVFAASPTQEYLMIKMTKFGSVQYYGNYTHHFHKQRLHLLKEKHGTLYKFLILSLQQTDQGHYICKVQEIGKHRNKWTAWSNGTAATEIRVISSKSSGDPTFKKKNEAWKFFEVKHYLVKCPQNRRIKSPWSMSHEHACKPTSAVCDTRDLPGLSSYRSCRCFSDKPVLEALNSSLEKPAFILCGFLGFPNTSPDAAGTKLELQNQQQQRKMEQSSQIKRLIIHNMIFWAYMMW
ncbi:V-set and transmembrane domain-containing protein 4 isoform X6 [Columba livia]|uniref:V-set and transmembrane domain-containing protein 4 isoform X6 n=1 Tax=Columba livia TaxID=8932 RepID=UPI0031BA09CB